MWTFSSFFHYLHKSHVVIINYNAAGGPHRFFFQGGGIRVRFCSARARKTWTQANQCRISVETNDARTYHINNPLPSINSLPSFCCAHSNKYISRLLTVVKNLQPWCTRPAGSVKNTRNGSSTATVQGASKGVCKNAPWGDDTFVGETCVKAELHELAWFWQRVSMFINWIIYKNGETCVVKRVCNCNSLLYHLMSHSSANWVVCLKVSFPAFRIFAWIALKTTWRRTTGWLI